MLQLPPGRLFQPWPPGIRFENVSKIELARERLTDGAMPPQPDPVGLFGSSAASRCVDHVYAERESGR
jgi:hypothetical protein